MNKLISNIVIFILINVMSIGIANANGTCADELQGKLFKCDFIFDRLIDPADSCLQFDLASPGAVLINGLLTSITPTFPGVVIETALDCGCLIGDTDEEFLCHTTATTGGGTVDLGHGAFLGEIDDDFLEGESFSGGQGIRSTFDCVLVSTCVL